MQSSVQPPPQLEPHDNESSLSVSSSGSFSTENISEVLYRILSKLTIYQSLQEHSSLVITVRDDVSMMDACALFLPSLGRQDQQPRCATSLTMIEVLTGQLSKTEPQSPESKARTLFGIAKNLKRTPSFSLLPDLIEEEAKRSTKAGYRDTPIGDFLTVSDFLYFINYAFLGSKPRVTRDMTVRAWIDLKRQTGTETKQPDDAWKQFCIESTLITRASVSLSHGAKENTFYSGSAMNMSVSNLLNVSTGSREDMFAPRTGGSCLHAVSELLARPWQNAVPLSVSTEKGISAIFGYTSLPQMMAHVAMNCSEQSLEPFFHTAINFDDLNSVTCVTAQLNTCTVANAFELMTRGQEQLVIVNEDGEFDRMVLVDDLCEIMSHRIGGGDNSEQSPLYSLDSILVTDELDRIDSHCANNVSVLSQETDFPITLSILLQRLLLHSKSNCVLVLENEATKRPVKIVSVRDVWNHVLKKNTSNAI
jgi:hypothetical protein